jgi:hypothetical protein
VDNSNPRTSALKSLAEHVRDRAASDVFTVVTGPRTLTPREKKDRQQFAECVAAELDNTEQIRGRKQLDRDRVNLTWRHQRGPLPAIAIAHPQHALGQVHCKAVR